MQRRERIFWLIAGLAMVVGIILLIPTHYEICKEGTKTGEEACTSYRLVPFLVIEIGKSLDALGVAITALATIAIAWFTLTLRQSTDRLWKAGDDAFAKLNRPYIFVFGVKDIEPGPTEHIDASVPYTIANHGQSPAMIERLEYCLASGVKPRDTGPAWDDHPLVVSPVLAIGGQVIAQAQSVEWLDSGGRVVSLPNEAFKVPEETFGPRSKTCVIPEIKVPGTAWYLWVKVFYRGPFSTSHETSACWRYDMEPCQFVQFGGAEYNYTK